jgi:hypothetical protein
MTSLRTIPLHPVFLVLIPFLILCSGRTVFCAGEGEASDRATISSDGVAVYAEMSRRSQTVKFLAKGDAVTVAIEIEGAEDRWCGIVEKGQATIAGYVQCAFLERQTARRKIWMHVGPSSVYEPAKGISAAQTKVVIEQDQVLIPVTLRYKDKTADVLLLLDTGASISLKNTELADQLGIRPDEARRGLGQVVGGELIPVFGASLSYMSVGPHTKSPMEIGVFTHSGPPVKFAGLLGMNFLRGLKYYVDFKNQVITWEP